MNSSTLIVLVLLIKIPVTDISIVCLTTKISLLTQVCSKHTRAPLPPDSTVKLPTLLCVHCTAWHGLFHWLLECHGTDLTQELDRCSATARHSTTNLLYTATKRKRTNEYERISAREFVHVHVQRSLILINAVTVERINDVEHSKTTEKRRRKTN